MFRKAAFCMAALVAVTAPATVATAVQGEGVESYCASFTWAHTTSTEADANVFIDTFLPSGSGNHQASDGMPKLAIQQAIDAALQWAQDPQVQTKGGIVVVQVDVITPEHDDPAVSGNRFTVEVDVEHCLQKSAPA